MKKTTRKLIPKLSNVFIYICNEKYSRKDIRRFISFIKINKETGCWEWIGCKNKKGYGRFICCRNGKAINYIASRTAQEMATGIIITSGMCVCHHCDNPKCVNVIDCLFVGTSKQNTQDMINKGRIATGKDRNTAHQIGEKSGLAKLTWILVNEIRRLWNTGKYSLQQLADKFKVTKANIGYIIRNNTWVDKNYIPNKLIHYKLKLNQESADKIRTEYNTNKYTHKQLADKFGVTRSHIGKIIRNEHWT